MQIVLRILEYIWYPLFLTGCFYLAIQLGVFDDVAVAQAVIGALVLAYSLWKLSELILSQDWSRQVYLAMSFCWMVTYFAWCIFDPSPRSDAQIKRIVWYAMTPLLVGAKHCLVNPRKKP